MSLLNSLRIAWRLCPIFFLPRKKCTSCFVLFRCTCSLRNHCNYLSPCFQFHSSTCLAYSRCTLSKQLLPLRVGIFLRDSLGTGSRWKHPPPCCTFLSRKLDIWWRCFHRRSSQRDRNGMCRRWPQHLEQTFLLRMTSMMRCLLEADACQGCMDDKTAALSLADTVQMGSPYTWEPATGCQCTCQMSTKRTLFFGQRGHNYR